MPRRDTHLLNPPLGWAPCARWWASCTRGTPPALRKRFTSQVLVRALLLGTFSRERLGATRTQALCGTKCTALSATQCLDSCACEPFTRKGTQEQAGCGCRKATFCAQGLQLIWSVSRRAAVIRQHSICMQHVFAAFCKPAAPRSALSPHHLLLHTLSGRAPTFQVCPAAATKVWCVSL